MRRPLPWAGAYALVASLLAAWLAISVLGGGHRAIERSDFVTYQTAGRIVLHGDGACLYVVSCQSQAQRELVGDEPTFSRGALPFNSPPWLAALVAPLALLPLHVAFAIFTLLSLAVLGAAAWRLAWGGTGSRLVTAVLLLSAWPTVMGAIRGQSTLAVAGLLGFSVAAAARGTETRSGLMAGLAALKPTLAPLWLARLAVERRWTSLLMVVGALAALVGGAALVVSPQAILDYPPYLLGLLGETDAVGVHVEEMINWRGAAVRLGMDGPLFLVAGMTLTLALLAAAWWWARSSPRCTSLGAAAALLATPLLIPHANQHEAILASVGVLLLVAELPELRVRLAAAAIGCQALLWVGPALSGEASAWLIFVLQLAWLVAIAALSWREGSEYFRSVPVPGGTE